MMTKLLRYLSIITLFAFLVACEDDEEITDNLPPEDANLFSFKDLQISQTVDQNGNTYISSGVLTVDADISSEAQEGFSKQVLIQIVKWENGEEVEITKGAPFNLSGNGNGDAKTFNLNFSNIVEERTSVNIGANLLEAGSQRKIKGQGIIINAETEAEDNRVDYKIKTITWSTDVDNNNDGFFASRSVDFIVATEGDIEKTLNGTISIINDTDKDTTEILQTGDIVVKREGFSEDNISFSLSSTDMNLIPYRSGYEILMRFTESGGSEVVFQVIYKAADFIRIGFESAASDNREYSVPAPPVISTFNQDTAGFADSALISFQVSANNDLEYFDLDNTGREFDLRAPYARLQYIKPFDPEFTDYAVLADSVVGADPVNAQSIGFVLSDELNPADTGTYDFRIMIMEPSRNYFNSNDDIAVDTIDKDDFAVLGGIKLKP